MIENWSKKLRVLILDVDGVLTNGQFVYSSEGKMYKIFGPDDNDAISLLSHFMEVRCITGDRKGYEISRRRVVSDMGLQLDLVSTIKRASWIAEHYDLDDVIYMGDGIFDHYVMKKAGYSIAPANADKSAKEVANYVTERSGGDRAVAEACLHIMDKFFERYDPNQPVSSKATLSGEWTA